MWASAIANSAGEIGSTTMERVRRAYLAAMYPAMTGEGIQARRQYAFSLTFVATRGQDLKQWCRGRDDEEVRNFGIHVVCDLIEALDETRFIRAPSDEVVEAMRTRTTRGFVAWLMLRTGALGEKQRDKPDQEDVNALARQLRKDALAAVERWRKS